MRIHVIIPYFRAYKWAECCIGQLLKLAVCKPDITVVNMDPDGPPRMRGVDVVEFTCPHLKGGEPLAEAIHRGLRRDMDADIAVTVDTDAITLRKGWDQELRHMFEDPTLVCAGINPRSDSQIFAGFPEWNWMAFRPSFWKNNIDTFDVSIVGQPDIGHILSLFARRHNKRVHLWPMVYRPFAGKAATICGDEKGLWASHAFYSSRRFKDDVPADEHSWMLTPEQEDHMREMVNNG